MTPFGRSRAEASRKRKHQLPEQEAAQAASLRNKRQKLDTPPDTTPLHHLDALSKAWLTKETLRELDGRTRKIVTEQSSRQGPRLRRPLTRGLHRELQKGIWSKSTSASEFLEHCCPGKLRELEIFAKHGGPDLRDLRGHPEPAHPSQYIMNTAKSSSRQKPAKRGLRSAATSLRESTSVPSRGSAPSSGANNPNFEMRMIDSGVYPCGYEYPDGQPSPVPANMKYLQQMIAKPRSSLLPHMVTNNDFDNFYRADNRGTSENNISHEVIPLIRGTNRVGEFTNGGVPLNNFANMLDTTENKLHKAKPDLYYGARPEQLRRAIRAQLSQHVEPSTTKNRPLAPNFFVEVKGPKGMGVIMRNQACIDGALGARAIHSLQTYGSAVPKYDNIARTITVTYQEGSLKLHAHHTNQPNGPGTEPEYYMTQLGFYPMTRDRHELRKGLTAFRNAQEYTRAQRNAVIENANAVWDAQQNVDPPEDTDEDDDEDSEEDEEGGLSGAISNFSSRASQRSYPAARRNRRSASSANQEAELSPDELALDSEPPERTSKAAEKKALKLQRHQKKNEKRRKRS